MIRVAWNEYGNNFYLDRLFKYCSEDIEEMFDNEICAFGGDAITLDVPGVDPETINVEIDDRKIVVSYDKHGIKKEKRYVVVNKIDPEKTTATCKLGVLTIDVVLLEPKKTSKKIPVRVT